MKRYIIQDRKTGKFLRRVASYGSRKTNTWVNSADDATLITTSSAATCIVNNMPKDDSWPKNGGIRPIKYYSNHYMLDAFPFKVIPVGILMYPIDSQPFIDGVLLYGNRS